MARLPTPGGDDDVWGVVLNDFLGIAHNTDGTIKSHNHTATNISDFSTATDARITAQKGVADGLATLDTGSKIPISQIPTGTTNVTVSLGNHSHATATQFVSGFMSFSDKGKLDGVAANANNYVHPAVDGSLHVPATGTINNGKVLRAGATAGSLSWDTVTATDVGAAPASHGHLISDITNLQTTLDSKYSKTVVSMPPSADLDTYTETGFYVSSSGTGRTNTPPGEEFGHLVVTRTQTPGSNMVIQEWTQSNDTNARRWWRRGAGFDYNTLTWGVWKEIASLDATAKMPIAQIPTGTSNTTVALGNHTHGTATVATGGTGRTTSTTAYGVIAAGTTATGAHQTIAPGTAGQVLRSNGAAALATFQTLTPAMIGAATSSHTHTDRYTFGYEAINTNKLVNGNTIGQIVFASNLLYTSRVTLEVTGNGGFEASEVQFTFGYSTSPSLTVTTPANQFVTAQGGRWASLSGSCMFDIPSNTAVTLTISAQVAGGLGAYYRCGFSWRREITSPGFMP